MSYQTLSFITGEQGIAILSINRPKKLNALNKKVLNELAEVIEKVKETDEIRGMIVTGAGDKAFVAGADIKELQKLDEVAGRKVSHKGQRIFLAIEDLRKPVIAAVNGYALGGGAELAMACHLRVASPKAAFGLPEVGLGLIPGFGGTQRLPRIVGRPRALEMILTGKQIKADEARAIGLINGISEEPLQQAKNLMRKILSNGPLAIQNALKAVYHKDGEAGFQLEADLFGRLCATEDAKEGTSAFLEKRKPEFKGV